MSAVMMREIITRYGREGIGFLWLVGEPLIFCLSVIIMWSLLKPEYEYGVRVAPFIMTGYMCLLLLRHQITSGIGAVQANVGLLYHRQVKPLHLFIARAILEVAGGALAFFIVYTILMILGQVGPPQNYLLLYWGYFTLALLSFGTALIISALAMRFEAFERLSTLITYLLIPISGSFFMVSIVPPRYRDAYLLVPFPNSIEMVRAGVFGEFVETHYNFIYPFVFSGVLILIGLAIMRLVRDRIDLE